MEMDRHARRKKRRRRNLLSLILLLAALVVLIFALSRLIPILRDYWQSKNVYESLSGDVLELPDVTEIEDDRSWAELQINFDALWAINTDVIAWIRFDDLNAVGIDYPVLHGETNDTYLRHDLYGDYHTAGSVFLEAANNEDFSDLYNIIYGHNMRNDTMFGSLKKYRNDEDFYEDNRYFTIYTPEGAYRYEIFGYADVPDDDELYTVGFAADDTYQRFIERLRNISMRDTGIIPDKYDHVVSLSTCTAAGDTYRFVVFGVCVDQELY